MTIYTKVEEHEVSAWLKERGLGQVKTLSPIEEGVEDSVYCVDLVDGSRVCLRIFERTEPEGPLTLAARLAEAGLPTCPPIMDEFGTLMRPLKDKPASIYPWVEGHWVERPNLEQIEEIGVFLGQLALAVPHYCQAWHRKNPRGWDWVREMVRPLLTVLQGEEKEELQDEVRKQLALWESLSDDEIPFGPIHADIFRNNVMFGSDGKLAAVIDWGFCASDEPLLFDLAIVANDWCLDTELYEFDLKRLQALLRGRARVAPLTSREEELWPMALRWAALRFYLSRLYDWHFPRDPDGKKLDPTHFHKILRLHRKAQR